jgi:YD repeat-containing protein
MGRRQLRSRLALAAGLLLGFWLGGWGLGRSLAHRDAGSDPDTSLLAEACQKALSDRLGSTESARYAKSFLVKNFGDHRYRLVSHFDQGGGRTRFACDATARVGAWEVTDLALVRW